MHLKSGVDRKHVIQPAQPGSDRARHYDKAWRAAIERSCDHAGCPACAPGHRSAIRGRSPDSSARVPARLAFHDAVPLIAQLSGLPTIHARSSRKCPVPDPTPIRLGGDLSVCKNISDMGGNSPPSIISSTTTPPEQNLVPSFDP